MNIFPLGMAQTNSVVQGNAIYEFRGHFSNGNFKSLSALKRSLGSEETSIYKTVRVVDGRTEETITGRRNIGEVFARLIKWTPHTRISVQGDEVLISI